jgi:hypothetical protein
MTFIQAADVTKDDEVITHAQRIKVMASSSSHLRNLIIHHVGIINCGKLKSIVVELAPVG